MATDDTQRTIDRNAAAKMAIDATRVDVGRQTRLLDRISTLESHLQQATNVIVRCKGLIGTDATVKLWNTGDKPAHEWLDESIAAARSPFLTPKEQADGGI